MEEDIQLKRVYYKIYLEIFDILLFLYLYLEEIV